MASLFYIIKILFKFDNGFRLMMSIYYELLS